MIKKKAFTLAEILITIAIGLAIITLSFPIALSQSSSATISSALTDLNSQVFTQEQSAYSRRNNNSYGVYFYNNRYTVYTGASLAQATDTVTTNFPNGMTATQFNLNNNQQELNFQSGNFRPNTYGNIKFSYNSLTYFFEINSEGLTHFYKQ